MRIWYGNIYYKLRSGYWFIPLVLTFGALLTVFITTSIDARLTGGPLAGVSLALINDVDTARQVVSTAGGAIVTLAGTIFSLTLVALVLASQQYGPRILEAFLRDSANQFVLGFYIAAFGYNIAILSTIRPDNIPRLSIVTGVIVTFVCLILLIYYINHIIKSIRAETIIGNISHDIDSLVRDLYPCHIGDEPPAHFVKPNFEDAVITVVGAWKSGYFQNVDGPALVALVEHYNAVIRIESHPGEFVLVGTPLITILEPSPVPDGFIDQMKTMIDIDSARTVEQDVKFLFDKLVETSVRSMSPAINDPVTAMMCLDRLAEGILALNRREMPSCYRMDEAGALRVIVTHPVSVAWMIHIAFDQPRRYARTDLAVQLHMLRLIGDLASQIRAPDEHQTLYHHAELIIEQAMGSGHFVPDEISRLQIRFKEVKSHFDAALLGQA